MCSLVEHILLLCIVKCLRSRYCSKNKVLKYRYIVGCQYLGSLYCFRNKTE